MAEQRSLVIDREWSKGAAEWDYILREYTKDYDDIEFTLKKEWHGDKKWAERNAKHFGIPMPKEKED